MKSILEKPYLRTGLIFLVVFLAHANFLFPRVVENPDSNFIYPFLESITSPLDYLSRLANLETIDFQPVRDLTLYIDVWMERTFQLNVSIFLNCLIWAAACTVGYSILTRFILAVDNLTAFFLICCYAVYPIFLQTINWGISRKHLLAFLFTLLATRSFFWWLESGKGQFRIVLFYTLSVLSLPISIGWPVWCAAYLWLVRPEKINEAKRFLTLLSIIMLLLVGINWVYYKASITYLELYPKKATFISLELILSNLGHQIWQLVYPYNLSLFYTFQKGSIIGLLLLVALLSYLFLAHRHRKDIWAWLLFAAAHVAIILTTPTVYFDPYVLMPSFAILVLVVLLLNKRLQRFRLVLLPLFIFWTGFTLANNTNWGDSEKFFEMSFETDESCSNAVHLGFAKYAKKKKIPNELFDFIQVNRCLSLSPLDSPSISLKKLLFESISLYYEEEIDLDYRKRRLLDLGARHFYPMLVYSAILAQEKKDEALENTMELLLKRFDKSTVNIGHDNIFSEVTVPYCMEKNLSKCRKFIQQVLENEETHSNE